MKKLIFFLIFFCFVFGIWFLYSEIYKSSAQPGKEGLVFSVQPGESVATLAARLEKEQVIRSAWLFQKYLVWKGLDKKINYGEFKVDAPFTIARLAAALSQPGLNERVITIIPGWTLGEVAEYLEKEGLVTEADFFALVGKPAVNYKLKGKSAAPLITNDFPILVDKPWYVSYEGYLAPDTYRIYNNATVEEIVERLIQERNQQITEEKQAAIKKSGRTWFEVLTMASILEREVRQEEDLKKVADIFWRRYDLNWALQADSTVHYATGKIGEGELFTTKEDRDFNSPWNTYKYPGLPLGPICNPSLAAIEAAIYPTANDYWYFLTTTEGQVIYSQDLEEHNANVAKYLYVH
ncbi:MAG TPA: endolytic transglycosylase MltG [Patescibacteria group bacterium]|nr:endolytic transglycosylase MltG [Patescibacteria group bacterium]